MVSNVFFCKRAVRLDCLLFFARLHHISSLMQYHVNILAYALADLTPTNHNLSSAFLRLLWIFLVFSFANNIKIICAIKYLEEWDLLQSDINSVKGWRTASYMKLVFMRTKIIAFSRRNNILVYEYKLCQSSTTRIDSIKNLKLFMDSKLHFYSHVNYKFSQRIMLLGLVRRATFASSSLEYI